MGERLNKTNTKAAVEKSPRPFSMVSYDCIKILENHSLRRKEALSMEDSIVLRCCCESCAKGHCADTCSCAGQCACNDCGCGS